MAKQIIILETNPQAGGRISVQAVYWYPVAIGKRVPVANLQSAWKDASAAEITALQDGSVYEEVHTLLFPEGTTAASIKAGLIADRTSRGTYLASLPFKLQYNGVYYDNGVWSA